MIKTWLVPIGVTALALFMLLFLSASVIADDTDRSHVNSPLINTSSHYVPIEIYSSGNDIIQQVFRINLTPPVIVSYGNYTIEVYYYHPTVHGMNMHSAVSDPISLMSMIIQKCYNNVALSKYNVQQAKIDRAKVQHLIRIERNIKNKYRYLWACPSTGTIFIGVKSNQLKSALTVIEPLVMELLNQTSIRYHRVFIYGLEYGLNESPLSIGSSYYYRLDSLLKEKYGMSLGSIAINGHRRPIISEDILTGRPILMINTSLYLRMIKTNYEESKKIAYQIGLSIAKALSEIGFPLHHVDIVVYYNASVKVHFNVKTRKIIIQNSSFHDLVHLLTQNSRSSSSIRRYNSTSIIKRNVKHFTQQPLSSYNDNYSTYGFKTRKDVNYNVRQRPNVISSSYSIVIMAGAVVILLIYVAQRYLSS